MQSFIDLFIHELINKNKDLSGDCVVFPTRRAGLIFKKKFSDHISKPTWLPAVYSIDDFISFLSPYKVADATHLVLELYTVYKNLFPQTPFEKYIPWGEMLLKDFNEADLQMVNAEQLFSEVISLKEIDLLGGVNEEETERIKAFWKLFSNQEISRLKEAFLDNWRSLPVLYNGFRKQLHDKGMAYNGMAARAVASGIAKKTIVLPWDRIYFAGFYALSNAEKDIFNLLVDTDKAEALWDADRYYTVDKRQEAGKYFRKKQLINQPEELKWTFDYFKNEARNIHVIGVPLNVGQAKYAGVLLRDQKAAFTSYDHTAVVIPDEKLLMPVLYSLPSHTDAINVTMGYPLQGSNVELLTRTLKAWWEKKGSFLTSDLVGVMENNFIYGLDPGKVKEIIYSLKNETSTWLDSLPSSVAENPLLQPILTVKKENADPVSWLTDLFRRLLLHYTDKQTEINLLDFGLLKYFYEELEKLSRLIAGYKSVIDFNEQVTWKLILELLRSLRVPFSGEPVKGLQIMGFLETRNLDFENLYILSVNEEVMPGTSTGNSYIPFAIRKAYGLPTFEDQDAIYAYHFYRLLQRAKNIHLLYNTVAGQLSGGEKSRYILQLAHEMKKRVGDKLHLTHQLIGTDLQAVEIKDIVIKKDKALLMEMEKMYEPTSENAKKLSATALTSYIACSLSFYYRHIAGIREPDEIKDEIDPAVFGNIIHLVMEQFYKSQSEVTAGYIQSLLPGVEQAVDDAIRVQFPARPGKLTGKNSLLKTVMTDLVKKILLLDKGETPFSIMGLEKAHSYELKSDSQTVTLYGKIDRIDEKNNLTRIIDYKTGKDQAAKKFSMEELFTDPAQKASFQLMFYSMLYKKEQPLKKVKPGIFSLRSLSQGIDFLNGGAVISDEQLIDFETRLKNLVSEIFNPEIDFRQTTDLKSCLFCPYKEICNR